jgi:type II secretory pathway component PulJ
MTLLEAVMASLLLMLGSSAAARLWSHGLQTTATLGQREERLDRLEALLLASEGLARDLAVKMDQQGDCQVAITRLRQGLQALAPEGMATLSHPPSPPGTVHLRWESDGLRRERVFSPSVWGLCRGGDHGP